MEEVYVKSFDGTKLFFNKELVDNARAAIVIVHGLCEHQGRYDYFAEKLHQGESVHTALTTEDMEGQKANGLITVISTRFWTIPMYL